MRAAALVLLAIACAPQAARAQAPPTSSGFGNKGLTGEVQLTGSNATGNTEAAEAGFGVRLRYEGRRWRHALGGVYDFASAEGDQTRNRLFVDSSGDLAFIGRLFGFSSGSYERDAFSGYEFRGVLAAGLGYDILKDHGRRWTMRVGPGFRVERNRALLDPATGLLNDADTVVTGVLNVESDFIVPLSGTAEFSNRSGVRAGEASTNIVNTTALTTQVLKDLSLRLSFQVIHETFPPLGAEATDTITRVGVVYKFRSSKTIVR